MKYLLLIMVFIHPAWAQDNPSVMSAKHFDQPKREFSIIATDSGYFPKRLLAYVGEEVHFFVTASSKTAQCFLIKDHEIYLSAKLGQVDEGVVEFKSPGRFEFYCPATKFNGVVTVLPRPDNKKKSLSRTPSSYDKEDGERPKEYWTPRDS